VEINVHTDLATGDVWLNLDWWKEPGGAKHPGGPFFAATKYVPVYPEKSDQKEPLTLVAVPPIAIFQAVPIDPSIGSNTSFDASPSFDVEGEYLFISMGFRRRPIWCWKDGGPFLFQGWNNECEPECYR